MDDRLQDILYSKFSPAPSVSIERIHHLSTSGFFILLFVTHGSHGGLIACLNLSGYVNEMLSFSKQQCA
jgi:hypothetical protein